LGDIRDGDEPLLVYGKIDEDAEGIVCVGR
jgi:hypothetical protein